VGSSKFLSVVLGWESGFLLKYCLMLCVQKVGPHFGCFLLVAYMIVAVGNPLSDLLCGCGHDLFWVNVCE